MGVGVLPHPTLYIIMKWVDEAIESEIDAKHFGELYKNVDDSTLFEMCDRKDVYVYKSWLILLLGG